jgi:hypothetical protein
VKSVVVLTAWGPSANNRDILMITVVSSLSKTRAEVDAMTDFLRALQGLQRAANGLPPLDDR